MFYLYLFGKVSLCYNIVFNMWSGCEGAILNRNGLVNVCITFRILRVIVQNAQKNMLIFVIFNYLICILYKI